MKFSYISRAIDFGRMLSARTHGCFAANALNVP